MAWQRWNFHQAFCFVLTRWVYNILPLSRCAWVHGRVYYSLHLSLSLCFNMGETKRILPRQCVYMQFAKQYIWSGLCGCLFICLCVWWLVSFLLPVYFQILVSICILNCFLHSFAHKREYILPAFRVLCSPGRVMEGTGHGGFSTRSPTFTTTHPHGVALFPFFFAFCSLHRQSRQGRY